MKKLFSSLLCALSVSFSLVVGVPGATAQTAPLPRFLPPESAGYTLVDVAETSGQAGGDAYVGYFGNDANTRAIEVFALPARSSEYEALFKKNAKKGDRVHGKPAVVSEDDSQTSGRAIEQSTDSTFDVTWIEKGNIYRVEFRGGTRKQVLAFAQTVRPTGKPDSSFVVKKLPAGMSTIFIGPLAAMFSSGYFAEFVNAANRDDKIELTAVNVDARYLRVVLVQIPQATPVTIRGKPGYQFNEDGEFVVFWMEQPNLFMAVDSEAIVVNAFAEALVPVDEPTWKAAVDLGKADVLSGVNGGNTAEVGPPVAAGNLGDTAWAASISGQCLLFAAGSSTVNVCAPGLTSPTLVAWKPLVVKQKTLAFGITGANVVTVVGKSAGVEIVRVPTQVVADQPGLRYFATDLAVDPATVTFVGLDAGGAEVGPATAAQAS